MSTSVLIVIAVVLFAFVLFQLARTTEMVSIQREKRKRGLNRIGSMHD